MTWCAPLQEPTSLPVNVVKHKHQRYAVWLGGSFVASSVRRVHARCCPPHHLTCRFVTLVQPGFEAICHSRAKYLEEGPRIARHNAVFSV